MCTQVKPIGWAMESRVYAEDPLRNFLPSIGTLSRYQPPSEADVLRLVNGADPDAAKSDIEGTVRSSLVPCCCCVGVFKLRFLRVKGSSCHVGRECSPHVKLQASYR